MLESVFIMLMAMGFVSFVLSAMDENMILSGVSLLMWIIVLAGQLYIEVPTDTYYSEPALYAISLGFIFINIVWIIVLWSDFDFWRKQP